MMTKRQRLTLGYFIVRALFLGEGIATIFLDTRQDAWIACIIGLLLGILFTFMTGYLFKNKKIKDLFKDSSFLGIIIRVILIILALFLVIISLLIIQSYTTSFFLINTPVWIISLVFLVLVYIICNKGLSVIGRVAEILLPISLLLFFITTMLLIPMIDWNNFLPILTTKPATLLFTSLLIAIITSLPLILLIQTSDDGKKLMIPYTIGVISLLLVIICTIGVLGPTLSIIFKFPEYMVLKRIEIFGFIEKIENILALAWIIDIFILISLAGMLLKNSLPQKRNNWYFLACLGGILYLASIFLEKKYYLNLLVMDNTGYILLILYILLVILLIIYARKRKKM